VFKAMAIKELRETRGIALLALAVYGVSVVGAMTPAVSRNLVFLVFSSYPREGATPFVNDSFVLKFYWISAAVAIALGMRQTVGESVRGTYPFLLHRPAERRLLIGTKLLVGMVVYLVCALLPLVIYSLWAATPGTHASPFEWSMTLPSWVGWIAMLTLYLGAFLSGIRSGRWYRSRLLPLAAAALPVFVAMAMASDLWWCRWSCLIVLVMDIWMIATILFVVRTRDYS
jgi:ABC-type transport system involved in multi-copper enzyme maturation permease subunit